MSNEEEPKIIIDEDWKTKVQAEKEEARKKAEEPTSESPAASQADQLPDLQSACIP